MQATRWKFGRVALTATILADGHAAYAKMNNYAPGLLAGDWSYDESLE